MENGVPRLGQGLLCQSSLFLRWHSAVPVQERDLCSQKACRSEVLPSLSNAMSKIPLAPLLYGLTMHLKCFWMGRLKPQTSSLIFMGY